MLRHNAGFDVSYNVAVRNPMVVWAGNGRSRTSRCHLWAVNSRFFDRVHPRLNHWRSLVLACWLEWCWRCHVYLQKRNPALQICLWSVWQSPIVILKGVHLLYCRILSIVLTVCERLWIVQDKTAGYVGLTNWSWICSECAQLQSYYLLATREGQVFGEINTKMATIAAVFPCHPWSWRPTSPLESLCLTRLK